MKAAAGAAVRLMARMFRRVDIKCPRSRTVVEFGKIRLNKRRDRAPSTPNAGVRASRTAPANFTFRFTSLL